MMKVRIYKVGEEVVVDTPSRKYQEIGIEKCPHPWRFRDSNPDKELFTMEVKELTEIKVLVTNNEAGSAQFYYSGHALKHDDGWNELLMPTSSVVQKHMKRLAGKLDAELAKPNPDAVKVVRFERERKLFPKKNEKEIYQQALANLDEDGISKPKIREKLQKRIDEWT